LGWTDDWDESLADIGETLRSGLIPAFVDIMDRYLNLLVPYCQVFCQKKQENLRMLRMQAYLFVIPARFWPESREALDGVDSG
jgi:hypothetical protein